MKKQNNKNKNLQKLKTKYKKLMKKYDLKCEKLKNCYFNLLQKQDYSLAFKEFYKIDMELEILNSKIKYFERIATLYSRKYKSVINLLEQ